MMTNKRRAQIANWAHADLFIRIHCDGTTGSGNSILYPNAPVLPRTEQGALSGGHKGQPRRRQAVPCRHGERVGGRTAGRRFKPDSSTPVARSRGLWTGPSTPKCQRFWSTCGAYQPAATRPGCYRKNPPKLVNALDKGVLAALGWIKISKAQYSRGPNRPWVLSARAILRPCVAPAKFFSIADNRRPISI